MRHLTTVVAGCVLVASMTLLPLDARAQLPPFGPIDNGSDEAPPDEPAGGIELGNFFSDVKLDFLDPGPVLMTTELLGPTLTNDDYTLVIELSGTTTATLFNREGGLDPVSALAELNFRSEHVFTGDEVQGTSIGGDNWLYNVDSAGDPGTGVLINLPDNADGLVTGPSPDFEPTSITLLGDLGPLNEGDAIDLYEFGIGKLWLQYPDDPFSQGERFLLPDDFTSRSLGELLPMGEPRNPDDTSFDYPLCWAKSFRGPGNSSDPRNFDNSGEPDNCLVLVDEELRNQTGGVVASGIVPEPTTVALLALGIAGVAARRGKRG